LIVGSGVNITGSLISAKNVLIRDSVNLNVTLWKKIDIPWPGGSIRVTGDRMAIVARGDVALGRQYLVARSWRDIL
jgi:hypothetical protein